MKKTLFAVSLLALASMAFGRDLKDIKLSAGGYTGFSYGNQSFHVSGTPSGWPASDSLVWDHTGEGTSLVLGAFVDATYLVASIGLGSQVGKGKSRDKQDVTGSSGSDYDSSTEWDDQYLSVDFQVLGKYPFTFSSVTIFPVVGFDYSINVSAKGKDSWSDDSKAEANDFFVDFGAGLDYPINEQLYLRGQALFGINLTPTIKSMKDYARASNLSYSDFGCGLSATLGVGYQF